jgi:hypothetical protein
MSTATAKTLTQEPAMIHTTANRHIYRLHEIITTTGKRVVGYQVAGISPDTSKRRLLRSIRGDFTTAPVGSYGYGIVDENGREVQSLNLR